MREGGWIYCSAISPGLSFFAIAGIPETAAATAVATLPAIASTPDLAQAPALTPVQEARQAPVATETTGSAPAGEAPSAFSAFPVMPAVLGVCCVILPSGGFFARRWWLRRQNPARFGDYEERNSPVSGLVPGNGRFVSPFFSLLAAEGSNPRRHQFPEQGGSFCFQVCRNRGIEEHG